MPADAHELHRINLAGAAQGGPLVPLYDARILNGIGDRLSVKFRAVALRGA